MNGIFTKKNNRFLEYAIFVFAIIIIFILRLTLLLKSNHPNGLDGYYYALQAKSLVENHALENPDYKLGYYLCALFSFICKDVILGCKIWASLASTILCISVFTLVKVFSKNKYGAFFALVLSGFCSPSLCSFEVNYINNLTGLFNFFFFASMLYFLQESFFNLTKKNKIIYIALDLIFLAASCLSHLVSTAYCFIFICLIFIRKIKFKKQIFLLFISLLLFIFIFITQIGRFKNVFSFLPVLPVFSKQLVKLTSKSVCMEFSIYFILSYFASIIYLLKTKKFDLFLLVPFITSFPFWNLNEIDMGYRMILNGLPCNICFIIIIFEKLKSHIFAQKNTFLNSKAFNFSTIALLFICSFFIKQNNVYNPQKDPPYEYYKNLVTKIDLPKDSLLIAHLGLNHCYTYYCDLKDCLNYNCDFEVPGNEVWRLAYGTNADYLKQFFGEYEDNELNRLIVQIDPNYVLIKEDLWQRYLKYEEDEIVDSLNNWFNPHTYRPSFIRNYIRIIH